MVMAIMVLNGSVFPLEELWDSACVYASIPFYQQKQSKVISMHAEHNDIIRAFFCFQSLSSVVGKANAQQVKDFFQQAIHGGKRRSTLFWGNTFKRCALTSVWNNILLKASLNLSNCSVGSRVLYRIIDVDAKSIDTFLKWVSASKGITDT